MTLRDAIARDPKSALPAFLMAAQQDEAVRGVRLWRVDQAMTGASKRGCIEALDTAARWNGERIDRPQLLTAAWVLDGRTRGSRLASWLCALSIREGFTPQPPDIWAWANGA